MHFSNYEISILVNHKPIPEYHHEGQVFVEGRSGSEYIIRIKNNFYRKSCFIVSVDGLSVINGQDCSNNSPGYIIDPYQSLDIECYKLDDKTGAKFVFGTKDKSYSAKIGKGTANVGVIGVLVFNQKYQYRRPPITISSQPLESSTPWFGNNDVGALRGWSSSNSAISASASYTSNTSCSVPVGQSFELKEQSLGTAFGESMAWHTTMVTFEREASPAAQFTIYYDSRKNLERRGIKFAQTVPQLPDAFPGNEKWCPLPPNWRK